MDGWMDGWMRGNLGEMQTYNTYMHDAENSDVRKNRRIEYSSEPERVLQRLALIEALPTVERHLGIFNVVRVVVVANLAPVGGDAQVDLGRAAELRRGETIAQERANPLLDGSKSLLGAPN